MNTIEDKGVSLMSRTFKRSPAEHYEFEPEVYVSHSKTCWMCHKGRAPKRMFRSKPNRRAEKKMLRREIESEGRRHVLAGT